MAGWTSGWVNTDGATAVANGATLNFTHNLGSTDLILSIFLADNQAGTNSLFIGNNSEKGSSGTQAYDAQANNLSPNSLTVQLGSGGYFNLTAAGQTDTGTSISFATKFIKVVAIAAISDPVPGTGDLCKILSEDSGYQMFRNGLTIQWMSSPAFITESSQVVDFPIAFAAKPLKVTASTRYPSDDGSSQQWIQVVTWDATSVTVRAQSQNVGTWTNPVFADIIAIGIAEVTDCPGSTDPNDPSDPEGTKISQLTSATELKDDDLFVISKENTGDGIYDISQKVTLSELSSELISKIPPTPVSSNFVFIDPVEIYNHSGFITLPWTTKDLSVHIPEGATGCIINITYGISGPDDGVPAKTLLRAKSGGFVYTAIYAGSWAGNDSIGGNSQGLYPINVETRSIDISIPVRSPNYQNVYLIGYF